MYGLTQHHIQNQIDKLDDMSLRQKIAAMHQRGAPIRGMDWYDQRRELFVDALMFAAGQPPKNPTPGSEQFGGAKLRGIAKEWLRRFDAIPPSEKDFNGFIQEPNYAVWCWAEALMRGHGKAALMAGSGDFPSLVADAGRKILLETWDELEPSWPQWAGTIQPSQMGSNMMVRLERFASLPEVRQGDEFVYDSVRDSSENIVMKKFGAVFTLSDEAIWNDTLEVLVDKMQNAATAGMNVEDDLVYAILTDNAAFSDAELLFSAAHGNIATGGDVGLLDREKLAAAQSALVAQVTADGDPLHLTLKHLIVPVAQAARAGELLLGIGNGERPERSRITLVIEPRLDAISKTGWYAACNVKDHPTIEVGFLPDMRVPLVKTFREFLRDALAFEVKHPCGAAVADYRGLYYNPGA